MRTSTLDGSALSMRDCVATIGFFDGVHLGHRHLIRQVTDAAKQRCLQSAVVTFSVHPRSVVHKDSVPKLLCTAHAKTRLIEEAGVDAVYVLPFDRTMADMSARSFMQDVLRDRLRVKTLVIGYDNHFGHGRSDGFDDYVAYGREMGIEVVGATAFRLDGEKVSSSVVRSLLSSGDVEKASLFLGRSYCINGTVVAGFGEGRKIGFPTANIAPASVGEMLPKEGVYAVTVSVEGSAPMSAMMNIGTRPTFGGTGLTVEINIFDFEGDLYGCALSAEFKRRIRGEKRFDSPDELRRQLEADRQAIKDYFENNKTI